MFLLLDTTWDVAGDEPVPTCGKHAEQRLPLYRVSHLLVGHEEQDTQQTVCVLRRNSVKSLVDFHDFGLF